MENCFMVDSSFVIRKNESDYLLSHEQGHFDIGEIYVRKMRELITKWDGSDKDDYNSYLLEGFNRVFSDSIAFQYERETNHGRNKSYQYYWNRKIDSLLKRYEAFNKSTFKLYWPSTSKDFDDNRYEVYLIFHKPLIKKIDTD